MRPNPLFVLAALGIGVLPAPAVHAQSRSSAIGTSPTNTAWTGTSFFHCQPMTAERCLNPQGLCDYPAVQEMYVDEEALCHHLINDAAKAIASQDGQYPSLKSDGTLTNAYLHPASADDVTIGGLSTSFVAHELQFSVATHQSSPEAQAAATDFMNLRAGWDASNAIGSCEEYAYEKFYDYSQFEDASLQYYQSGSFDRIADVAFADAQWPGTIGTRAITTGHLSQKNGKEMPNVPFKSSQIKNVFFELPLSDQDTTRPHAEPVNVAAGEAAIDVSVVGPGVLFVKLVHQHRELYLDGIVFRPLVARWLSARWRSGQETYAGHPVRDFAWHAAQRATVATATAYERAQWLEARDAFAELLRLRAEVVGAIRGMVPHAVEPNVEFYDPASPFDSMADEISNPEYGLAASYQAEYEAAVVSGQIQAGAFAPYELQYMLVQPDAVLQPPGPPVMPTHLEALEPPLGQRDAVVALFYQLQDIDDQLEQAFISAPAECITGDRCDWWPRDFAQAMSNHFVTERERAFATCVDHNANQITAQHFAPLAPFPGCDDYDYPDESPWAAAGQRTYAVSCGADTDHLEYCMKCYSHQFAGVKAFAGQLIDATTHQVRLLKSDGDEATLGNKWFGATVAYRSAFQVNNIDQEDPTAAIMVAMSALKVDISVLTQSLNLLDVNIGVSDAPEGASVAVGEDTRAAAWADVKLWIFGEPFAPDTLTFGNVNVVGGIARQAHTFAEGSGTIPIGPIVITIDANVTGEIGATYSGQGGATPSGGGRRVTARLQPYASLDAYAAAYLDYYAAKAGIRGHVTIAKVSVPLQVDAALDVSTVPGDRDLSLKLQGDVVFEIMSGWLAAFVEVDLVFDSWEAEQRIASWDGFRRTKPLMKVKVDQVPLKLLRKAADEQKLKAGLQ